MLVSFSAFLLIRNTNDFSIKLNILKILFLLTTFTFIVKDSFFNLKGLKNPSDKNIPKFLIEMRKPTVDASDKGAFGLFFMFIGFVNLKFKFLGGSDSLPDSFQYPFSIALIILGFLGFFLFMFNKYKKFQKFIIKRYQTFSKIIFYGFMLFFIFVIISMIAPFI